MDKLIIGDIEFESRLFLGTGKFKSNREMSKVILASKSEMVTVAIKRINIDDTNTDDMLSHISHLNIRILPNTSGVRSAKEAVFVAELSREAFETNFIKLEIHPDPKHLMPDPLETLKATEVLSKKDFIVLPYIHADPVLCKLLEDAGTSAVMPLGSPIGTNKGLLTIDFLKIIIEQSSVPVIIDAGIGAPSHATQAMEMGADAVLVNTAIAVSKHPEDMSQAFYQAVCAGRKAHLSGLADFSDRAVASSPLTSFLNEGDEL